MENSHLTNESNSIGESTPTPAAADLEIVVEGEDRMENNSTGRQSTDAEDQPKSNPISNRLYVAAVKGDWKTAQSIFDSDSSAVTMKINDTEDTVLHIAAIAAKHISFIENLVQLTSSSDLAAKNLRGKTALAYAAISGVVRIANIMIAKNSELPNLCDNEECSPVLWAVNYKRKDMASFLFSKTNFQLLNTSQQFKLLITAIQNDYYDIALDILKKKPELTMNRMYNGNTVLHQLALKEPSAIGSSNKLSFWKRYMNYCFKGMFNKALIQTQARQLVEYLWNLVEQLPEGELVKFVRGNSSRLLLDAARVGNVEFLIILIRSYPNFVLEVGENNESIFHTAVENRQESVFNLVYELGGLKDYIVNFYDTQKQTNMLHLAGKLAAPNHLNKVSGAALQMQRELRWFKEVEKIVVSFHLEMRCSNPELFQVENRQDPIDRLTPRELFTKEHKQLLKDGEKWMKSTANSCMLVATLITTVVFAAAFTVPGGNKDKEGIPIFRQNHVFTLFVISDVVALVLSTTSILTFLSILTSRYAEDDFLVSLPTKLLVGLVTLFISIICMVAAFSATFFIVYDKTKAKIPLAIAVMAIIPVGCFCIFQSKLARDILRSASGSKKKLF